MKIIEKKDGTLELRTRFDSLIATINKSDINFIDGYGLIKVKAEGNESADSHYFVAVVDSNYLPIFLPDHTFLNVQLMKGGHLITQFIEQEDHHSYEQFLDYDLNNLHYNKPINLQQDIYSDHSYHNTYWKSCDSDQVVLLCPLGGGISGLYDPMRSRIISMSREYTTIGNFKTVSDNSDEKFALATRRIYYMVGREQKSYDICFYIDEAGKIRKSIYDEFYNRFLSFATQSEYVSYFDDCEYYATLTALSRQESMENKLLSNIRNGIKEA